VPPTEFEAAVLNMNPTEGRAPKTFSISHQYSHSSLL
jgi:hypothetical protein